MQEYPPSFCDGVIYVNLTLGRTLALDATNGRQIWMARQPGALASTPAVDGPRLIVSSHGGTVTGHRRSDGKILWRLRAGGKVESSPVVVDGNAFFGTTEGRLFSVNSKTGRVRWAYQTGGRINASPSVVGDRVCISTYAGSIVCVRKANGQELWTTFIERDAFRLESFYASPSSDGRRLFTTARSGKVVALSISSGKVLWTFNMNSLAYATPAVAEGTIYVSCLRRRRARSAGRGRPPALEHRRAGRVLSGALVVGDLVFVSSLDNKTFGLQRDSGRVVWRTNRGRYAPGIATNEFYYFSLNGSLIKYRGRASSS